MSTAALPPALGAGASTAPGPTPAWLVTAAAVIPAPTDSARARTTITTVLVSVNHPGPPFPQALKRPGAKVANPLPVWPKNSDDMSLAWIDLVASDAKVYRKGHNYLTENDKKLRHVQNALQILEEAKLVRLPNRGATQQAYEGFILLDERGGRDPGEPHVYRVPKATESCFHLPSSFLSNAWVHVLEDSEISLLLMVACRSGTLRLADGAVAILAAVRSLHYGDRPGLVRVRLPYARGRRLGTH